LSYDEGEWLGEEGYMTSPSGNGTVSYFGLSEDNTIDAFINWGVKWGSGGVGFGTVVTYSFPQSSQNWFVNYRDDEPFNGFQGSIPPSKMQPAKLSLCGLT
jgi:hypothetical protein